MHHNTPTMTLQTLQTEDRIFVYSDQPISIPKSATMHMLEILRKWQAVFPYEATYVGRTYGIPSIIVRFDGVLTPDGTFDAYEIQSGCGWVGYAQLANPAFRQSLNEFRTSKWPQFKLIASPRPLNNPDELFWLEKISLAEAVASDDLLWVRYEDWEIPLNVREAIIARSLKPVHTHNIKRYGTELGWWKPVNWHESDHGASLPWHEAFVLKPVSGYGSTDIMLWKPEDRTGRATKTQILQALQKNGWMYQQRFIPPMTMQVDDVQYNMILRPFFGYDPKKKDWVPMHGVWTGRPHPNLRIHGASDAVTGPLLLET